MKHYPAFVIEQFGKHLHRYIEAFNNYRELIAVLDAIRNDKKAFKCNHFELAAFVNFT